MKSIIAVLFLIVLASIDGARAGGYGVVDISRKHEVQKDCEWWIQIASDLFFYTNENSWKGLTDHDIDPSNIYIIPRIHKDEAYQLNGTVLFHNFGFAIFSPSDDVSLILEDRNVQKFDGKSFVLVDIIDTSEMMASDTVFDHPTDVYLASPTISELVAKVDKEQWYSDVKHLASFNRYALGSDIRSAETWIVNKLKALPNINVSIQAFPFRSSTGYNIIATMTGTAYPDEWVIMGAHYDSTSNKPNEAAPGAEDNGSGSAGLLQMVRAFSAYPAQRTAIFIWFSAEEQGLFGSKYNAKQIVDDGDRSKVKMVQIADMIGYAKSASSLGVLLETSKKFASLFDVFARAAKKYSPSLIVTNSTRPEGSDHVPYIDRDMPALLTIDKDWDSYPHYHRTSDKPEYLNKDIAHMIIKMNVATCAEALGYMN